MGVRKGETEAGARAVFSHGQRWVLLTAFALLVIFRLPRAWAQGRFLDEEATVFLAYAWHHPWLDALFRPFGGYWNLGANSTTLLVARLVKYGWVSLAHAPYLTMTMALAVQLLPAVLILTGRATWLAGRIAVIAALLIVALAPATEEVFFNVLHIQFHLALCVALIVALDAPRRRSVQIGYGALLFLAPLCGPGAIAFLPMFALRGLVDRDRSRAWQLAAFAAGAAVQLLLFYGSNPMRGHLLDPGTIVSVMTVRLIAMPLLGFGKTEHIGDAIYASQQAGGIGWWWTAAIGALLFAGLIWLAARRRDAAIWLVLSGLLIAAASFGYGMVIIDRHDLFGPGNGERYNFLPIVLIGIALIVMAKRPGFRGRFLCAFLCLLLLVTGFGRYTKPVRLVASGPAWPAEAAAWQRDHNHPLAVWPAPWSADLSDETRPCPPIRHDASAPPAPRYCESEWVASFYRTHPNSR